MSLHEIRRWKRSGFTLMELLMAMVIAIIVMGSAVTLLRHGVLLMASNVAYTAAQRGALSSLELLSDEISTAGEVEIISDDTNHKNKIEAALADGWRY
ncbi:MAG: prepilin-type N-terminal cleavage/methylation domain-containing protein, partial [Synergistaceae bacterium]|nr:prepilin-type N-terminal cleavage/methylation domain-containing protein [Synergistaceae bacterium]